MEPDSFKRSVKFLVKFDEHQPYYYNVSNQHDPVEHELKRLDKLEAIVFQRNLEWVTRYCRDLWARGV